ncbi:MAG: pseudouridine synthase, partial [candidate division Zixibacteria bacterium]|nr:pseudouridine synthase [candidate division Zixibacteria bacterium]
NDGEMAHRLTHPRYEVTKVYRAKVQGDVSKARALILSGGVALPDGTIGRAQASIEGNGDGFTVLRLELTEGRKREVKHLCKAIGHPVISLERRSFAGIDATGLEIGKWRYLTAAETDQLRRLVKLDAP